MKKLWGIERKVHVESLQRQSLTSRAVMRTLALGQKVLVKGAILAMERECKSLANDILKKEVIMAGDFYEPA